LARSTPEHFLKGKKVRLDLKSFAAICAVLNFVWLASVSANEWVEYEGKEGPGAGKHIVLISGDEEYRSEEALPMLAKILAVRHGFRCTVLFSINPADGTIDPTNQTNIPGFEKVADADLVVLFLRFRELPDEQMKHFVDYVNSGKPVLALRTSTHAFEYERKPDSPYAKYGMRSREWEGGFGQQVLGETWVSHHGDHGKESARGLVNGMFVDHPVLRGVTDIWGPTDVYGVQHLPPDAKVLVYGQVLTGMRPNDPPNFKKSIMPMIWQRDYKTETGNTANILCSTIGAATDLESEGLRRLLVNYCYWSLGLTDEIPQEKDVSTDVRYVGEYHPSNFGFDRWKRGVKPADYAMD
jgi:type 1 glutamine amidotransferase